MSEADIVINAEDRLVGSAAAAPPGPAQALLSPGALAQLGRLWRRRPDDEAAFPGPGPAEPVLRAADFARLDAPGGAGYDEAAPARTETARDWQDWPAAEPVLDRRAAGPVAPMAGFSPEAEFISQPEDGFRPEPEAGFHHQPATAAPLDQTEAPHPGRRARAAAAVTAPVADPVQAALPRAAGLRARLRAHVRRRLPRLGFTPLQRLAAGGIGMLTVTVTLAVIWYSGVIQRTVQAGIDAVFAATGRAGFRVEDVTVAGRARTTMDQVAGALGAGIGSPILAVDLEEVKDRLEALASVRQAAVERVLPGTLHIALAERQPIAVWQNNGEHVLVDDEGKVIPGTIAGFETLPLVVGDGAGQRADEVLAMLSSEPTLASRVKAAIRVGNRRWNLMLDDPSEGLEIRLPEDEAEAAWHRLAELERQQGLSTRHVRMVDLRQPDRLILKTERPATAPETVRRKDNGAG